MKKLICIVASMATSAWLGYRYMHDPLAPVLTAMVGGIIAMGLFVPTDTKKPSK